MEPRAKKRLFNTLRIVLCVAALAIVIQGVTIRDHVVLEDQEAVFVGTVVEEQADALVVRRSGEPEQTIPLSQIAVDEQGNHQIRYGLRSAWSRSTKVILLLAVAIHFPVVFPQSLRFQWMLRAQSIHVGYWECVKLSFAGNFLNFATPFGSNIGDVFKAYFVSQHTEHKAEAITTVALDRIIGLVSLLLVVAAITTFSPNDSRLAPLRPYMLTMLGICVVGALAYLSPVLRKYLVPRTLLNRLPMIDQLRRADQAVHVLARSVSTIVAVILLTIFLQAVAIGAYFTVAVAMRLEADAGNVLEYYTYFYTGVLVQTLPGPPQGLGTVELAYRFFLAPYGSPSQIVCVALGIRLVALTVALPGLLVTMTGSYKPRDVPGLRGPEDGATPAAPTNQARDPAAN